MKNEKFPVTYQKRFWNWLQRWNPKKLSLQKMIRRILKTKRMLSHDFQRKVLKNFSVH